MINLLKKLIIADSTETKGELGVATILAEYFCSRNVAAKVDNWDTNRANCNVHVKGTGEKTGIVIAGHIDVVPRGTGQWQYEPFDAVEIDGKIFGRGAADMKGGIAATAKAITDIIDSGVKLKGDLIFTASAGEETDSCGIKQFIEQNKDAISNMAGAIVPEPTNFDLITAHKGLLWLEIVTTGKTAHGSMPEQGINAIDSMRCFFDKLSNKKSVAIADGATMSINQISGGTATNVIPDKCRAEIDIRTLPGQSHENIINNVQGIFNTIKNDNPNFDATVNISRSVSAFATDNNCDFVKQLQKSTGISETKTACYTTDGPYLAELNLPTVIFGPGDSQLCHKPDEYIKIADMEKAAEILKKVILDFLG